MGEEEDFPFQIAIHFLLDNLKSHTICEPEDQLFSASIHSSISYVSHSYSSSEQNFGPVSDEIKILVLPS